MKQMGPEVILGRQQQATVIAVRTAAVQVLVHGATRFGHGGH